MWLEVVPNVRESLALQCQHKLEDRQRMAFWQQTLRVNAKVLQRQQLTASISAGAVTG